MRMFTFCSLAVLLLVGGIVACSTTGQPSCNDTPRNMRCMTGQQLEEALSK